MSSSFHGARPAPDPVLVHIADYVLRTRIDSALAYETARHHSPMLIGFEITTGEVSVRP